MTKKYKFRRAIGFEYHEASSDAPTVIVKGEHFDADEVVSIARRFGIPVVEKPEIAKACDFVELDERIPEKLFEAVAALFHELKRLFIR